MYGWWIMPIFGIIFLVICLYFFSRFFGCGRGPMDHSGERAELEDMKNEIQSLRDEIRELKKEK